MRQTSANPDPRSDGLSLVGCAAVLVLDGRGTVLTCTAEVEQLTGSPAAGVCGRPAAELLAHPEDWPQGLPPPNGGRAVLRRAAGGTVEVCLEVLPLGGETAARHLVRLVPAVEADRCGQDNALVRALFTQTRVCLAIHDRELRTVRVNNPSMALGLSVGADGCPDGGADRAVSGLEEALLPGDAAAVREQLRKVAETGVPLVDWVHSARRLEAPRVERTVSLSAFRLEDAGGGFAGVAVAFTDVTEQERTRQQLALVAAAAKRLESTLDVVRCAEQLAEVMVPDFADLAAVDLTEAVLVGEEPGRFGPGSLLRRVAVAAADGRWPEELYPRDAAVLLRDRDCRWLRPDTTGLFADVAEVRGPQDGGGGADGAAGAAGAVGAGGAAGAGREPGCAALPHDATSMLTVPLNARGLALGSLLLWRTGDRVPFRPDDAVLGEEIGSRAALGMDSARRYTREHRTAEALQRSLLPRAVVEVSAAETVGQYVPAATAAGIGGSWFDVVALSSARIALVVGDVVGHGLEATAATGRLRTAVQTLSDLDMAPEELLSHLDDLVVQLTAGDADGSGADGEDGGRGGGVYGSTCLYAVYDPVTGHCSMASAGHPPPVVALPGRPAGPAELVPGPALGVGGEPFEQLELDLAPGSVLALFTDKLLADPAEGAEERLRRLCARVGSAVHPPASPAEVGRCVLEELLPEPPAQDLALLVSRVRALPAGATAAWEFPGEPSAVAQARELVTAQLAVWGLEELAFTTELIASELVTNSIRYAGAPVGLRLIRDRVLVCEVSDPSQTQPRLRHARLTDEGGRGLFLIAQLAHRWGSRYTRSGKTIWTEQQLPPV